MKKINLFALMTMLFSVTLFVGCSSDDDEKKDDGDELVEGLQAITVNGNKWYVENDEGYYYYSDNSRIGESYTYIKETQDFGDLGYYFSLTSPVKEDLVKGFSFSDYYSNVGFNKPIYMRDKTILTGNFDYDYVSGTAEIAEATSTYFVVEFKNFKIYDSDLTEESYNHKREYTITGKMKFQFID